MYKRQTQHKTRTEQRLAQEINTVVAEFRTRLSENDERYQYYETLLNTVDSSLLVVDSLCNIHWMNRAAMQDLCGYCIPVSYTHLDVYKRQVYDLDRIKKRQAYFKVLILHVLF